MGPWHSLPNGDPAEPFADDTAFCATMLAPPLRFPREFGSLTTDDGREIAIYAVIPLLPDELDAKLAHGMDAILDGFDRHGVTELFEPRRGSSLAR